MLKKEYPKHAEASDVDKAEWGGGGRNYQHYY